MRHLIKFTTSIAIILGLSGCMSFNPVASPQLNHYRLMTQPVISASQPTQLSIAVMPFSAANGFDTDSMLYSLKPYQISAFAKNNWVVPPANMLTPLLISSLQNSHYFQTVAVEPALTGASYVVDCKLLALYQDFSVKPSEIVMTVQVNMSTGDNKPVASTQFTQILTASADTPEAGVAAANIAASNIIQQITEYVIAHS